jgi:hypothetical protein
VSEREWGRSRESERKERGGVSECENLKEMGWDWGR